jgi:hypothetical protein
MRREAEALIHSEHTRAKLSAGSSPTSAAASAAAAGAGR